MDYHDGKYGINTDPNRGADTFIPFHSGNNVYALVHTKDTGGTSASIDVITMDNRVLTNVTYTSTSKYPDNEYFNLSYSTPNWSLNILKDCVVNDISYKSGDTIKWHFTHYMTYIISIE